MSKPRRRRQKKQVKAELKLRQFAATELSDQLAALPCAADLPRFMVDTVAGAYAPADAELMIEGFGAAATRPVTLRANTLRATAEDIAAALDAAGIAHNPVAWLTHLKAIAAARDAGAFVCYAPRMAKAAPCWPDAAALRETALQFFPQADVLLLKDSDLVPLFGSHELRTALFSLFSGHVELIFYSSSDNIFLFTRNVLLQAAASDLTEAQFLRDLARLNTWPDKLAGLRETTLKKLFL